MLVYKTTILNLMGIIGIKNGPCICVGISKDKRLRSQLSLANNLRVAGKTVWADHESSLLQNEAQTYLGPGSNNDGAFLALEQDQKQDEFFLYILRTPCTSLFNYSGLDDTCRHAQRKWRRYHNCIFADSFLWCCFSNMD